MRYLNHHTVGQCDHTQTPPVIPQNDLNTRNHSDLAAIYADELEQARQEMSQEEWNALVEESEDMFRCLDCGFDVDDEGCCDCDDGQPTEYDEWQDVFGGDDYVYGSYGMEDCGGFDFD